jgi:hypothetical protein
LSSSLLLLLPLASLIQLQATLLFYGSKRSSSSSSSNTWEWLTCMGMPAMTQTIQMEET